MTTSRIADDPRKICPVCGKEFTPGTSKQIYCSQSCGARSRRAVDPAEIVGQRNGKCTVIGPAEPDRFGHSRIMLRCDCGEEFPASLTAWVRRHTPAMCRKCSGLRGMKPERDRTGERIGSLTILGMEGEWRGEMPTKYRVRCEKCGSETVMDGAHLRTNEVCVYCARQNLETGHQIMRQADIDGTNAIILRGTLDGTRTVNKNSTTGIRGVNRWGPGRYRAVIVFKRKQYHLGTFDRIEDAAAVRRQAEEHLYGDFLAWYAEQRRLQSMTVSDRVVDAYRRGTKITAISRDEGISPARIRRILVDAGAYASARTKEIQQLAAEGLTREQIAERLHIQPKAVDAHLPYSRGTYDRDSSTTAWRRKSKDSPAPKKEN